MKPFCQYCFNDPTTHNQQKELCGTCEMETKVAKRKITNGDRIRSLTDEELAKIIPSRLDCSECPARIGDYRACVENCKERWLAWLKQEAKDD